MCMYEWCWIPTCWWAKNQWLIVVYHPINWVKACKKSSHTDRCSCLQRSIWTRASTVLHVHNGRYEHEHRPFSMLTTVGVRRLSQGFHPIFSRILPNYSPTFTRNIHCFNITMPLVLRYIGPYFLKPYSYNNTFLTTLFKTTLFKTIFFLIFALSSSLKQ